MLLKNKSARLITVDGIRLVPGAVVNLPEKLAKNKFVLKLIDKGELVDAAQTEADAKPKKQPAKKGKTVDDMTKEELVAYAEGKGIDLTGADDKASVLALIKAAEA